MNLKLLNKNNNFYVEFYQLFYVIHASVLPLF